MTRATVVIPVFNRSALTRACLDALAATPLGVDAEIVVVDDCSTDDTPVMLDAVLAAGGLPGNGASLRVVRHTTNTGFATACNDGAASAFGEYVVFLNNDTLPRPGWLAALVAEADAHPEAAAVGAKLLFPDGTVQHAGVVIGEDRNPHHVYAGFPGDHPAVNRPRTFQVATAACLLVRRTLFTKLGGFDTAFRNGHEDVDLCLRLRDAGWTIRYCPESVVVHLESATRQRRSPEAAANGRLYRERWAARVEPDDVRTYLDDGLLRVAYADTHPVRLSVAPLLATVHDGVREHATERLLRARASQVAELLGEVVRATVSEAPPGAARDDAGGDGLVPADADADDELIEALAAVQRLLAARRGTPEPGGLTGVAYRRLVTRVRSVVGAATPAGATVAVVSRGDDDLLDLPGRTGWHFPADDAGLWAGHHPADSAEAIAALDAARRRGATHLAVPAPSHWWLDHYAAFGGHLRSQHRQLSGADECAVFSLVTGDRP
jgi:GT2 family glycosyltransferase